MTTPQPDQLLGAPEWRGIDDYEVRKQGDEFVVRGYASLFDSIYPVAGGPDLGGFNERVDRGAFDKTLAGKPDVHFLINHEGRSLARTKSGTLKLATDATGLLSEARIDRRTRDGRRPRDQHGARRPRRDVLRIPHDSARLDRRRGAPDPARGQHRQGRRVRGEQRRERVPPASASPT